MRKTTIGKKLRSRKGASLALALMLLLVTSMVTAVVLASAVTTAKRERSRKDTQQTILTLQSAIALLRDQYTGSKVTIISETEGSGAIPKVTVSFTSGPLKSSGSGNQNPLSKASLDALERAYLTNCADIEPDEEVLIPVGNGFSVSAQVGDDEEGTLENVNVSITMRGNRHSPEESYMDYQIQLTCGVDNSNEQLSLKLDTDVSKNSSTDKSGKTTEYTEISWRPEGEA